MISGISAAAMLAWLPVLLGVAAPGSGMQPSVSRMIVREQIVIKIPVRPRPLPRTVRLVEHKGPKCIDSADIRGAVLPGPTDVDFLMQDRTRIRAKFDEECPALDFWQGFYLKLDGERLCAKQDFVHSRMGGSCRIEQFRRLTAEVRD